MRRAATWFLAMWALLSWAGPAAAQQAGDFRWSGSIAPGEQIEIKGVNGTIRAELASGPQVEVVASKRARRSDPNSVSVQVVQDGGSVTICAVYPTPTNSRRRDAGPNECRPGESGRMHVNDNDVVVDFTVRVPAGVRFVGRTVNGSVEARSLQSDVTARTVNGRVALSTTGLASAETVNGAIDVTLGTAVWTQPLEFNTVNGSITVTFPPGIDAQVRAETMNGSFTSEFPVTIQSSRGNGRRISGVIGNGGRELQLHTVNGSIRLVSQ
jgi:hypothetical protein